MSNRDWYVRHLRGDAPQPPQAPLPPMPEPSPATQMMNRGIAQMQADLAAAQPTPGCPQCGSPNYGKPSPTHSPRCFECGYGLSIQNSTQGVPAPNTGVATPAVQVPTAGYQPTTIVGKVS